jgi:dethiobiotin synthetase
MAEGPRHLLVIAGTGTEVGKTWVAARLAQAARDAGLTVAARKPVQSFEPGTGPTDAEVLAAATGERTEDVCPPHRSYELAVAPFMAAARLGRPSFTLADLSAELRWPPGTDLGLLEPAGGVRSPMSADGADTVDLLRAVRPDGVALVADAGLGTINAVRLSLDALSAWPVTVVLNRYDDRDELHRDNRTWLEGHVAATVVTDAAALLPG